MKSLLKMLPIATATGLLLAMPSALQAAEVTLKAGFYSTSQKSLFRLTFNEFVTKLNADGKGEIKMGQIVDSAAIPSSQMPKALKDGILDLIAVPPSYMDNLLPGIGGMSAARISTADMRANGTFKFVNDNLAKNAGARLIGLYAGEMPFYIFTSKPVRSLADFKNIRLRATNTNREAFKALGAQPLNIKRGEIYTALQRGVADGYANINNSLWASSWVEVAKYRIDPGFFSPNIGIFVSLKKWNALNDKQKAALESAGKYSEGAPTQKMVASDEADAQRAVKEKGFEIIKLPDADAKKFLDIVYTAQWDAIERNAKDFGPQLRAKIAK